jgi:hypothetical protein
MLRSAQALNWPGTRGFGAVLRATASKLKPEAAPPAKSKTILGNLHHSKSKASSATYVEYAHAIVPFAKGGGATSGRTGVLAFARVHNASSSPAEEQPGAMTAVLRRFIEGSR